jgi:hypothetical protein
VKYPNLLVHDLGVEFVDGVVEVSDAGALKVLATLDGVTVEAGNPKPDPAPDPEPGDPVPEVPKPPRQRRPRSAKK